MAAAVGSKPSSQILDRDPPEDIHAASVATRRPSCACCGGGTALVAEVVSWIAVVANVGVVAFMVSSMVRDHSGKLWAVREVRARCGRVQREARMLWTRIRNDSISDQIVEERWADLQRELDEAPGTMADLATREDLNIQAAQEATSILEQEYARQN